VILLGFGAWDLGFLTSVSVVRFIPARRRPFIVKEPVLHFEGVAKEALRVDALRGIMGAGINATRD
jgi:hypothetical protein